MKSPCNQTCTINRQTGYCQGCGRNLREIQEWPRATNARKRQILAALPQRLAAINETENHKALPATTS